MSTPPKMVEITPCYVCHGTGMMFCGTVIGGLAPCWYCPNGTIAHTITPDYPSMSRAIEWSDPFQNGAHTTMPTWYVQRQIARWEINQ